ncbi:MAG: YlxR family protein [Dehalococcoidales bacterium]|nr:YlxR family protein [Dehalococcoidales bacterium]
MACRQVRAKKELVRLVRTRGGDIEIDVSGKKDGRGAYICPDPECWESAMKGKQLEHTLRCNLTQDNREQLARNGKDLLKEIASA